MISCACVGVLGPRLYSACAFRTAYNGVGHRDQVEYYESLVIKVGVPHSQSMPTQ